MMMSEFIERVGFEPTTAEYADIEWEYMGCEVDKDKFCKEWKKNGGIQRLCRMRARKIEELEAEVATKDRQYEEMDTRHCRQFNEMNNSWKIKVAQLEAKVAELGGDISRIAADKQKIEIEKHRAEESLEVIRKALAILGIAKEV